MESQEELPKAEPQNEEPREGVPKEEPKGGLPTEKSVSCKYCREDIHEGARLCRHCKSYQQAWRNWIPHFGVLVALITIASALTGGLTDVYKRLTWRDSAEVVYLKAPKEIAVLNNGSGTVFVQGISIECERFKYRYNGRIGVAVKKNEIINQTLPGARADGQYLARWPDPLPRNELPRGATLVFFLEQDQELDNLKKSLGPLLPIFSGTAKLTYRSTRYALQRADTFKVTGVILKPK